MNNFISPALIQAQRSLLSPGIQDYVSAEVASIADAAQKILQDGGSEWEAMKIITSKLKFAQTSIFSRNNFASLSNGPNELISQSQVKAQGVSNIANRKLECDALIYGIKLGFITAADTSAMSNVVYNNLTASAIAGIQGGQFELWYGDGLVFDDLAREFFFDGTVKELPESDNYYPLVAPIMVKRDQTISPVLRLGTAVTPGSTNNVYTHVGFKAISIKVRVIK